MARKSIKGYAEKNYYDNTRFKGITATTDPLNEGYFKHLVNFDIADTGQSITPRKGMKTYDLRLTNGSYVTLEKDTIYFRDPSTGLYIFCCFNKHHSGDPVEPYFTAYKTDFTTTMPISVVSTLQPLEFAPIETYAKTIYDHYQIQRNVIKAYVDADIKYINLTYRAEGISYEDTTFTEDTLLIDIVDTEDIGSIDTSQRNIASTQSIIPDPIQLISDEVLVNNFPMIYVKTSEGKYAINSVTNLKDVELIPHFELQTGSWGYAYDILSSYPGHNNIRYSSELFDLYGNALDKNYDVFNATKYYYKDTIDYTSYNNYLNSLKNLTFDNPFYKLERANNSINIYVFPVAKGVSIHYNGNESADELRNIYTNIYTNAKDNNSDCFSFVEDFPVYIDEIKKVLNADTQYRFVVTHFSELVNEKQSFYKWKPTALFSEYMEIHNNIMSASELLNYIFEVKPKYINLIPFNLSSISVDDANNITYHLFTNEADDIDELMYWELLDDGGNYTGAYLPKVELGNTVNRSIKIVYDEYTLHTDESLFQYDSERELLSATLSSTNPVFTYLDSNKFFYKFFYISLYIFPLTTSNSIFDDTYDVYNLETLKLSTNLMSTRQLIYSNNPTYYIENLDKEPKDILSETPFIIFNDRIVTWINNTVYMSEENAYYYFKYANVFNYPERVIKAIAYKDTVLVFTTQNLYCIYPYEYTESVQDGVDDEGNPKYVQQKVTAYASLPVLYNLMVDEKYANAIQVFNQMILFYSADGQLFMIKPTASIDSNTRFSIQFFNKSANDILANYDLYINERREVYGLDPITKEDVDIKVECTLTHIKIYYTMSDYTYILIYDVINNYYYVYDTVVLYGIQNIIPTDGYDNIIVSDSNRIHFSTVHKEVKNVDKGLDQKHLIKMELDTGTINLNNHLKKRFRALHTTYKNIDADNLKYNLEVLIDDVPAYTTHEDVIELEANHYTSKTISNEVDLLEHNTLLFHFTEDSLNKIITHRSNIVSVGKTIRLKTTFESAGRFKLNGYGLIYKEHQI